VPLQRVQRCDEGAGQLRLAGATTAGKLGTGVGCHRPVDDHVVNFIDKQSPMLGD
jgi:hypothetical protein